MAELLLELLSEEIPARMQDRAREDLAQGPGRLADRGRRRLRSTYPQLRDAAPTDGGGDRIAVAAGRPGGRAQRSARRRAGAGEGRVPTRACRCRAHAGGARGQEGQGSVRDHPRARPTADRALGRLSAPGDPAAPMAKVDALGKCGLPLGSPVALDPVPVRRQGRTVRRSRGSAAGTRRVGTASWRRRRSRCATSPTTSSSCARPR